ncbi:MAG: hypothetical protein H7301_14840 [Cryobacterium sp.]|nr:hypothetical protein [Oligoflexia bacterium]
MREYFGEVIDLGCGTCDNCLRDGARGASLDSKNRTKVLSLDTMEVVV